MPPVANADPRRGPKFVPTALIQVRLKPQPESLPALRGVRPNPGLLEKLRAQAPMMRERGYELDEENLAWRKVGAAA